MAWLWNGSAFVSAFLLFVAQPMLAKWLLPQFGGSPGTWAACMLFFQSMLLLGYALAHGLSFVRQPLRALQVYGLFAALAGLSAWRGHVLPSSTASALAPALRIPWVLLRCCGVPYLLLASTAPLLQRWAALLERPVPHRLYAISNAGSLLGLVAYPIWLEGALPVERQYAAFSAACALFALAAVGCALFTWRGLRAPREHAFGSRSAAGPEVLRHERDGTGFRWASYAFVPSVLLLAVTNHITVDIAPVPLLWVVPLALYLISFIVAFAGPAPIVLLMSLPVFVVLSVGLAYNAFAQGSSSLLQQMGVSLGALFLGSLLVHDALVRSRPPDAELTRFYLWIASGGALGGLFVSVLAPLLFDDYYELELASMLTYGVLLWPTSARRAQRDWPAQRRWLLLGVSVCLPLMAANVWTRSQTEGRTGRVLARTRSFLGPLRVVEFPVGRLLTHGRIRHGMQLSGAARRRWPTMYFGPGTALAAVLGSQHWARSRRIGVVGLGVGTLAAYGQAGDTVRFYELDANVVALAQRWFSFLRDSPARVELALGDGRLLLSAEPAQHFDVLVLDAFSSDAVPVHLLTLEAFDVYLRHLSADGVLLANVSNRHLSVDRVVSAAARARGLACRVVETRADADHFVSKVRWAVMARDRAQLDALLGNLAPAAQSGPPVLWTDARASLWSILR